MKAAIPEWAPCSLQVSFSAKDQMIYSGNTSGKSFNRSFLCGQKFLPLYVVFSGKKVEQTTIRRVPKRLLLYGLIHKYMKLGQYSSRHSRCYSHCKDLDLSPGIPVFIR